MKKGQGSWDVELADAALSDYREILLWTQKHFGERQASAYADALDDTLAELSDGPPLTALKCAKTSVVDTSCCIWPAISVGAVTLSRFRSEKRHA